MVKLPRINKVGYSNEKGRVEFHKQWDVFVVYCTNLKLNTVTAASVMEICGIYLDNCLKDN